MPISENEAERILREVQSVLDNRGLAWIHQEAGAVLRDRVQAGLSPADAGPSEELRILLQACDVYLVQVPRMEARAHSVLGSAFGEDAPRLEFVQEASPDISPNNPRAALARDASETGQLLQAITPLEELIHSMLRDLDAQDWGSRRGS